MVTVSACARGGGAGIPYVDASPRDATLADAALDATPDASEVDATMAPDASDDGGAIDAAPDAPPPECTTNAQCDDGLACNGQETCGAEFGCQPGTPIVCDDSVSCTTDLCTEPAGACVFMPTDNDHDGHAAVGCGDGDDCNDSSAAVLPGAVELCDGLDNDCSTGIDDGLGMDCVLGAPAQACVTTCGTAGFSECSLSCSRSRCLAADEVCNNGCDDDGDTEIDEGCPTPPTNDTCAGAIVLTGASGTRTTDSIAGATADTTDCAEGVDVFYRFDLTKPSIVYLDTFGSSFDTSISYRGSSCPGEALSCDDDDCSTVQARAGALLPAGTHFFAVHAYYASDTTGTVSLRWQVTPAPAGGLESIDGSYAYEGYTTSSAGRLEPECGGSTSGSGNEVGYYWFQCPGEAQTFYADTCWSDYDTVLSVVGPSGTVACDDDSCGDYQSSLEDVNTSGPGVYLLIVDSYDTSEYGYYELSTDL